jgi:tetratricopeptide (TPR) repeat protein
LIEGAGPSIAKARVLAFAARLRFLAGDLDRGIHLAEESLSLADDLDLDELRAHALATIGSAKMRKDRNAGEAELERALQIARAANSPLVPNILNNLGVLVSQSGDIRRARELYREGVQVGERLGDRDAARFTRANAMYIDFFLGNWDEVTADADRFIAECETSPHYMEGAALLIRGYIRLARGDETGALADLERSVAQGRDAKDPQRLIPALLQLARGLALVGRSDEARALAVEGLEVLRKHPDLGEYAGQIAGVAGQLGLRQEIRQIVSQAPEHPWQRAAAAGAEGDFIGAAEIYAHHGAVALEADERFNAAEELTGAGRRTEGEEQLEKALAFYRTIGGTFFIQRGEALRAQAATG